MDSDRSLIVLPILTALVLAAAAFLYVHVMSSGAPFIGLPSLPTPQIPPALQDRLIQLNQYSDDTLATLRGDSWMARATLIGGFLMAGAGLVVISSVAYGLVRDLVTPDDEDETN